MSDLPAEGEHQGAFKGGRPAGLGRLAWVACFSSRLQLAPAYSCLLCCLWPHAPRGCTAQTLSSTPLLALLLLPLDGFALSHFYAPLLHMPPWYSYKTRPWLPPHACPLHVVWWKMLEGHPVMHHGGCMVRLTRLPPSKHVLMLSTPLILKNKNKLRACNKALKTNVSRKCFLTTFILVSPVLFAFISWEQAFPG
jgi:hypothetical protein